MNVSTLSSSSGGSSTSSSSSDDPIRALAPAPIAPLRVAHENEGLLVSDIMSVLTKKDMDRMYNLYQIPRDLFRVYAPNSNVHVYDQIPVEDTIMVYGEHLNAGLRFPMDPFFIEDLSFHELVVAQLHPNS